MCRTSSTCGEPSLGTAATRPRGTRPTPCRRAQHLPTDARCASAAAARPWPPAWPSLGQRSRQVPAPSPPPPQLPSPPSELSRGFWSPQPWLLGNRLPHAAGVTAPAPPAWSVGRHGGPSLGGPAPLGLAVSRGERQDALPAASALWLEAPRPGCTPSSA